MGFRLSTISRIDAYPRTEEHLTQQTITGALVTLAGVIMMVVLFAHELNLFLTPYTVHEMAVDTNNDERLPILVNITFPSLPCNVLSLDALDMSGKHEVDIQTNIWKVRLTAEGEQYRWEPVHKLDHAEDHEEPKAEEANETAPGVDPGQEEHGDHQSQHRTAHYSHRLHHHQHLTTANQFQDAVNEIREALEKKEGCRVFGTLEVQRVAGNFHISVHGQSFYVLQQAFSAVNQVNVSHVIHQVAFGAEFPGMHNPLDGYVRMLPGEKDSGTFKYFIKLVPTTYNYLHKTTIPTNQYSVTEYFTPSVMQAGQLPAVYFLYDLSPITHSISERRRSFFHFITRVCAVLGGTFAVTGMIDKWVERALQVLLGPNKAVQGIRATRL